MFSTVIAAALVLVSSEITIPAGNGFIVPTEYRTLGRYQLAIGADAEYPMLRLIAEENAARRAPRPLRILHVIVKEIDAEINDRDGNEVRARSVMSKREIERCREWFGNYQDLVFTYTRGALRVERTELLIETPVHELNHMGNNRYWLSAWAAIKGYEDNILENYHDSIAVYYKKPDEMQAGLLGGAIGRDHGVRGSAFWTQWIPNWDEEPSVFSGPGVVSVHEWLHNISFYSHHVMGYRALPDCHAAEEYGYWDTDGGYRQWQAWNRDLMLHYIPQEFWYKLDTRGEDKGRNGDAVNKDVPVGGFFKWSETGHDWMALLPTLSDSDLQRLTGITDLVVEIGQKSPNSNTKWRLKTETSVDSPTYTGDLLEAPIQFDNVLLLARRDQQPRLNDPYGGYASAPLEGMALIRIPGTSTHRRDLVIIRPDIAPVILPQLRVVGRNAADSIVGYLNRQDPAEGQQVNMIVVMVDLGDELPADELAAIGR